MIQQRSSMLDLVRRTCDGGEDMEEFEGVYEHDPEHVAAWAEHKPPEYNGEYRYVNAGPHKVRQMLEAETDPKERVALELAQRYWGANGGYAGGGTEAALHPMDHGVARPDIRVGSMAELVAAVAPVAAFPTVMGSLRAGGIPSESPPTTPGDYVDRGIIDWDHLLAMGPPDETEDWF